MPDSTPTAPRIPPRWFVRAAWVVHRAIFRVSGGSRGIWPPKPDGWGALQLTTTGRKSGEPRSVILGYLMDGPRYVVIAMNGWGAPEPAWWLNLQADAAASVRAVDWSGRVVATEATGAERDRLWALWSTIEPQMDGWATLRPGPTAVVVLEPVSRPGR